MKPMQRRQFIKQVVGGSAAIGFGVWSERSPAQVTSPNEKLNIGMVGTSGHASFSIANLKQENLVAFCDVDEDSLGKAKQNFPNAEFYADFRKLLDQKNLDAVVVATPDHIHALATTGALRRGKHVYCEKPLTHTVDEARQVADAARKAKVATQMGTQLHATDNYRRVVELIQSGVIGKVKEVHTFVDGNYVASEPPKAMPVPTTLNWDLWLGPAAERPYSADYHPFHWRKFWDFGGAMLADLACHHMDLPFWALGLTHPHTILAEGPPANPVGGPAGLKVRYEFQAEGKQPAVTLTWYDGDKKPSEINGIKLNPGGNLFVGEKGMLQADYTTRALHPASEFANFTPPEESILSSIGHHNEWVHACKTGAPTTCNFDYSGPLTETVQLGIVAHRAGKEIIWDSASSKITNDLSLNKWLSKEYRKGWELDAM